MELPEAGGQAEVCELDVAASIQQDVVWLDISVSNFSEALLKCPGSR